MRALTRARCVLLLVSLLAYGCVQPGEQAEEAQDPHAPGEQLGAYAMGGALSSDACGAASLNAPERWSFSLKLSRQGDALYWLNGREAIVGEIDAKGRFAFETHLDIPLTPKRGAAKGCTIVRSDSAKGTLAHDAGSLSAELTYSYAATPDSDCAEEVATAATGMPRALPCALTYALRGERVE
jgi:hypothetical protein